MGIRVGDAVKLVHDSAFVVTQTIHRRVLESDSTPCQVTLDFSLSFVVDFDDVVYSIGHAARAVVRLYFKDPVSFAVQQKRTLYYFN